MLTRFLDAAPHLAALTRKDPEQSRMLTTTAGKWQDIDYLLGPLFNVRGHEPR